MKTLQTGQCKKSLSGKLCIGGCSICNINLSDEAPDKFIFSGLDLIDDMLHLRQDRN
jgi:hypothetical protein